MEIRTYFEPNRNENTTYQSVWDTYKSGLKRKCMSLNAYIRKKIKVSKNNPSFHFNNLKKKSKLHPKWAKGEILKIQKSMM